MIARHDYLPFGEEIPAGSAGRDSSFGVNDSLDQKFTGQQRDNESGEDNFNARYFAGSMARFMSPDPMNAGAVLTDPQSWNGYSYVRNNPMSLVDPSGMSFWDSLTKFFGGCGSGALFCTTTFEHSYLDLLNWGGQDKLGGESAPPPPVIESRKEQSSSKPGGPPKVGSGVCVNGIGAGLTAGVDAGIGLVAGAVGTASVGGGISGTAGRAPDAGAFLSYGAAATTLRKSAGIPPQNQAAPFVFGAAAGAGVGGYITNASQTSQLGGPFMTFGVDFGYLLNFGAQASFGSDASGHPIFQVSGTVGGGAGGLVYVMTTNTKTAGIKSPCGG